MTDTWSSDPTPPQKGEGAWSSDPSPPKPAQGEWSSEPNGPAPSPAPSVTGALSDASKVTAQLADHFLGHVLDAFGQGVRDQIPDYDQLGLGDAVTTRIKQAYDNKPQGPLTALDRGFWEGIVLPAAKVVDLALRAPGALYSGAQQGLMAAGVPRDFVSIPDAFMGSPYEFHPAEPRPSAIPSEIRPIGGTPPDVARSAQAATGDPLIDSILRSPITANAIDHPLVDRTHSVPYTAGGSDPLADPTVYIDHRFPKEIEAPSLSNPNQTVKFDPAEPFTVHENVEQHTMEKLISGGMDDKSAYRVAHYEFAEKAEGAWYRANDIDQIAAEKIYEPILDKIQNAPDDNPPENLYEKPYPHDNDHFAKGPDAIDHMPSPEEIAQARKILGGDSTIPRVTGGPADNLNLAVARDLNVIGKDRPSINEGSPEEAAKAAVPGMTAPHGSPYSYDVVTDAIGRVLKPGEQVEGDFYGVRVHGVRPENLENINDLDHNDVEITHKNGVSTAPPRTAAMAAKPGESISEPVSPAKSAWRERFEHTVDRLETPEDAKALLRNSVPPDEFAAARNGDIPLAQAEALADASGLSPTEITGNLRGVSRLLKNDAEVRVAMETLLRLNDQVREAAKTAADKGTGNNAAELIKLQEAQMRHAIALEQYVGLRAEWGRTGNVMQEFMSEVKDAKTLNEFNKSNRGDNAPTLDDLDRMAKSMAGMDRESAANFLAKQGKPGFFDKLFWYWTHSILWGPVTHIKYAMANMGWLGYNSLLVKPVAAGIGIVHSALSDHQIERVYAGESAAAVAGMVKGVPNAVIAAAKAIRDNVPGVSPRRMAQGVQPFSGSNNPFQGAMTHAIGEGIGASTRIIGGIHTFFGEMGEQVSREELAYRRAINDGHKPWTPNFWAEQAKNFANPTDKEADQAAMDRDRANFVTPLGEKGEAISRAIGKTPLRWVIPFRHIPAVIFKAVEEGTPLAFADKDMRANLLGKNGDVAQHTAIARMTVASGIMGYVAHRVLTDEATGDGPQEPKARAEWLLTHQPNSIKVGGYWYSFNRIGPMGDWMNLGANLVEAAKYLKQGDYEGAAAHVVWAGGRWVTDSVGMNGLANLFQAINQPEGPSATYAVQGFVGGFIPFSGFVRQSASMLDPVMRDAKGVVDGLRSQIPDHMWGLGRENLPVRRDWLGTPVYNPMEWAVSRTSKANADPLNLEMQRLDINPTLPERMVKGQKLNPQMYDELQVLGGPALNLGLHQLVQSPAYAQMPDGLRDKAIKEMIKNTREMAEGALMMRHPELIQNAIQNKTDLLLGNRPSK